jgi:hypothetical protein
MLNLQGVLNANSRFTLKSWESQVSNAENPGAAKKGAKPKKPKQTQLRETRDSAAETRPKLDVGKTIFSNLASFAVCKMFVGVMLNNKV